MGFVPKELCVAKVIGRPSSSHLPAERASAWVASCPGGGSALRGCGLRASCRCPTEKQGSPPCVSQGGPCDAIWAGRQEGPGFAGSHYGTGGGCPGGRGREGAGSSRFAPCPDSSDPRGRPGCPSPEAWSCQAGFGASGPCWTLTGMAPLGVPVRGCPPPPAEGAHRSGPSRLQDALANLVRRSQIHFVHCLAPRAEADGEKGALEGGAGPAWDIPALRAQLAGGQILDALRLHRIGEAGLAWSVPAGRQGALSGPGVLVETQCRSWGWVAVGADQALLGGSPPRL